MDTLVKSLNGLNTMLVDSRNGYTEAAKVAKEPALKALFQDMIDLHTANIAEVSRHVARLGGDGDTTGSFMSTVHRTVVDIRSAVTGLTAASLKAFASGEENILRSYDEIVQIAGIDGDLGAAMIRQRALVASRIEFMNRQAAAA